MLPLIPKSIISIWVSAPVYTKASVFTYILILVKDLKYIAKINNIDSINAFVIVVTLS
jgi:hypothetical protein